MVRETASVGDRDILLLPHIRAGCPNHTAEPVCGDQSPNICNAACARNAPGLILGSVVPDLFCFSIVSQTKGFSARLKNRIRLVTFWLTVLVWFTKFKKGSTL